MDQLHFILRPSLFRLGIMVGLFIVLSAIFSQYFNGILFGLSMLAVLIILYFVRETNPVQEFVHLDGQTWTLKFKNGEIRQADFIAAQRLAICIFMTFEYEENKNISRFVVTKDQLDLTEWKKLQTFIELQ